MESGVIMLSSSCPPLLSLAGVNSFMVYMAYKDLYQVSNTEVMTHCCAVWYLNGFPIATNGLGSFNVSHCGRPLGPSVS